MTDTFTPPLPDPAPTWDAFAIPAPGGVPVPEPAETPEPVAPVVPAAPAPLPPVAVPAGAHEMPSGNWVVMDDPRTLTRADKRDLIRRARELDDVAEKSFAITDLLHARLITAWSYPLPLPSADPAVLEQLPAVDDDALDGLIGEANRLLFPRAATPDDHGDPASPTAPSGG